MILNMKNKFKHLSINERYKIKKLQDEGHNLIVTVDCGTMAHDTLAAAHASGMDVIVADHHQTGGGLPTCFALVNPRRADDTSGLGHLAAVGVTFLLVVAVNRCLRRSGYFDTRDEPLGNDAMFSREPFPSLESHVMVMQRMSTSTKPTTSLNKFGSLISSKP